jgi:predicted amidophosphoribosyltransferase
MNVNIRAIPGPWDAGISLDKHTLQSTYIGDNEYGHPQFNTVRSEAGEALFQLKYRSDHGMVTSIAGALNNAVGQHLPAISMVVPMPPSKPRTIQPVLEIAKQLAARLGVLCFENLLVKTTATPQMKDIASREDRVAALCAAFTVHDAVAGNGPFDVLLVDDLFDTGSSLEAATITLRKYQKIRNVYVATVTRKH